MRSIRVNSENNLKCPKAGFVNVIGCYECPDVFGIDMLSRRVNCKRGTKADEYLDKVPNINKGKRKVY